MSGKQDIEKYGIKEFNQKCRESVFTYTGMWREMSERMGYLVDLDNPYVTLENDYIETGWWILKKFFVKDSYTKDTRYFRTALAAERVWLPTK